MEMSLRKRPLPVWVNFQQRALDVAILEINANPNRLNQHY
jgi:hypothetical protein